MSQQYSTRKRPAPSSSDIEPASKKRKNTKRRDFELLTKAKNFWESIRDTSKITDEQRIKLIDELLKISGENLINLCTRHDGSRVIQSCLSHGTAEQRHHIIQHLKGHFVKLSQSNYGHFLVMKSIKYASQKDRSMIISEFFGNVTRMLSHRDAADVINFAYLNFCNGKQRAALVEEFYGPQYKLFKINEKRTLESILSDEPHKKEKILENILESLGKMIDKGLVYHAIIHRVLLEYFTYANLKQKIDISLSFGDKVVDLIKTKEGSAVATQVVACVDLKTRKKIIKSLKSNIGSIAREPYGHMLLVRLIDVTDDTVLLSKTILHELLSDLNAVVVEQHARLPLLFILAQNSSTYFNKESLQLLQSAFIIDSDGNEVAVCKKPAEVRHQELIKVISQPLIDLIIENTSQLIRDPNASAILYETLIHATVDKSAAFKSIAKLASTTSDDSILQDFIASRVLKRLIKHDPPIVEDDLYFASMILEAISDSIGHWAKQLGASFIVAALLENPITKQQTAGLLQPFRKEIEQSTESGPSVIAKLLNELLVDEQIQISKSNQKSKRKAK